jgi:uncharacterized membrane protein
MEMSENKIGIPAEAAAWLEELKQALLSSRLTKESSEVVGYYEEFLLDAVEAGRETADLLARFGSPEQVVSETLSERSILAAEARPGPFRLVSASRRTLKATATAAGRAAIVTAAVFPLLSGLFLYLCGFLFFLVPPAVVALVLLELPLVPIAAVDTKAGLLGLVLLLVGLSIGTGWLLWSGANGLTRLTMRMLRSKKRVEAGDAEGTSGTAASATAAAPNASKRPLRTRRAKVLRRIAATVLSAAVLFGLILLVGSNLAYNYFSVWNGLQPSHVVQIEKTFPVQGLAAVRVDGMNSAIHVESVAGDEIVVSMESPDWLEPHAVLVDGTLQVTESSNGRLPFFRYVAIHEGTTTIRIGVPEGMTLEELDIQSTGSSIFVGVPTESISVHTGTGSIELLSTYYPVIPPNVTSNNHNIHIRFPD